MNRMMLAVLPAVVILATDTTLAQDDQVDYPATQVVEGWTCDYLDGKDREDLDKVSAAWNRWSRHCAPPC